MDPVDKFCRLPSPDGRAKLLALSLAFLAAIAAGGQRRCVAAPPEHFGVEKWRMDDGLPHTIVQAVTQTRDGYLWVGTREGLARFNGRSFLIVELPVDGPQPSISALCQDHQGNLWVGTQSAGIFRIDPRGISAVENSADTSVGQISSLLVDASGQVWVGGSNFLYRVVGNALVKATSAGTPVRALAATPQDDVIVVSHSILRVSRDRTESALPPETRLLPVVREVWSDRDGTLWFGNKDGITRLDGQQTTFYPKAAGPPGIVSVIFRDSRGILWLGTYGGLWRWENEQYAPVSPAPPGAFRVYDICEDREENLWVASEDGLWRLTPQPFRTYTAANGLSQNSVVSVVPAAGGGVWLGVWGGGVDRVVDNRVEPWRPVDPLRSEYVLDLAEDSRGRLWVGYDFLKGWDCFADGARQPPPWPDPAATNAPPVVAFQEDRQGAMWIGTRAGLIVAAEAPAARAAAEALGRRRINALLLARDGAMYVGSDEGLVRFDPGSYDRPQQLPSPLDGPILSIHEDAVGVLWLGTRGRGLVRFDPQGRVRAFDRRHGLLDDAIYAVLEDDAGYLWLSGSRTICRVKKRMFAPEAKGAAAADIVRFSRDDGIISSGQFIDVTQPVACKSPDGKLWFRTTQGVTVVDPRSIQINRVPPPVRIERIVVNREEVYAPTAMLLGDGVATSTLKSLVIPPGRGDVEIQFSALSYRAPNKNRFQYRLAGIDDSWVDVADQASANYRNLPPGSYVFEVVAANNDGVWNRNGASVKFALQPYFWQTWWFKALAVAAAAAAVAFAVLAVARRRMRLRMERLRQQHAIEAERARIARDMHDELGAKLTQISFQGATATRNLATPSVAAVHIERMVRNARELISSLDEIVWAVDPQNDSLENLATYICRYASDVLEDSEVQTRFHIPPRLPNRMISTDVRHNLFLAFKEALNNALKHSGADAVEIGIDAADSSLEVWIADNGRGLDLAAGQSSAGGRQGHGLANMRDRMEVIRGICVVDSRPDAGTTIRFRTPL